MDLELRHLRTFLVLAEELHFGRTAARLHVAQPALTQQVQRMERVIGTPLLTRTSRRVELTDAGRVLRDRARFLVRRADRDLEEVRRVGGGASGQLDLGFVSSATDAGALDRLAAFGLRRTGVDLRLRESFSTPLLDGLLAGDVDLAVVRDPDPREGVTTRVLLQEPFVAVLPAGHPAADGAAIDPAALLDGPFILYPRAAGARAFDLNLAAASSGGTAPTVTREASSWPVILRLVGIGWGTTVAPRSAATAPPPGTVVLPLLGAPESTLVVAARADDDRPLIAEVVDALTSP